MGNVRELLISIKHRSKLLAQLWYISRQPKFIRQEKQIQKNALSRKNGYIDERYEQIKKYKDIHQRERCFIVATGPSLTLSDLEVLKNEYTFGMNSIVKLFDKTDWRPTYY